MYWFGDQDGVKPAATQRAIRPVRAAASTAIAADRPGRRSTHGTRNEPPACNGRRLNEGSGSWGVLTHDRRGPRIKTGSGDGPSASRKDQDSRFRWPRHGSGALLWLRCPNAEVPMGRKDQKAIAKRLARRRSANGPQSGIGARAVLRFVRTAPAEQPLRADSTVAGGRPISHTPPACASPCARL